MLALEALAGLWENWRSPAGSGCPAPFGVSSLAKHLQNTEHRVVPSALLQVEQGPAWRSLLNAPGALGFYPAGLTVRVVHPAARFVQVLWDTNLHSSLLPELEAATSRFEFLYPRQDPLLSQIVTTLAQEIDGGFADRILAGSLGTALYMRLAQHFVGHLPLPTSNGLSPERVRRVRDYVETHFGDDLSLRTLTHDAWHYYLVDFQ